MNLSQFRQWILNNAWHGEQQRKYLPLGVLPRGLVQPDYTSAWGIDISHWDGIVRLDVTKALGASFVYIKAIDGTIQTNYFVENRQKAIDAELTRGAYGWLYRNANVSCVAQAQAYNTLMQKYPMQLPPVIDFEPTKWGGVASNPNYSDLRLWATEWLRLGNRKPILYSAAYYMNQFGRIPQDLKDMFDGIWIAHYGTLYPSMPLGYTADEWIFHQNYSTGDATVISPNSVGKKEVDLNRAHSKEQVQRLAGTVTEPPTGGTVKYNITNNSQTSTRTVRKGPGVVYASVDNLSAGGTAQGDFLYFYDVANTTLQALAGDKWIQIGNNRWLAWIHKGVTYLNVTTTEEPTIDINSMSVFTSQTLTFTDGNGNVIGVKGAENVELT